MMIIMICSSVRSLQGTIITKGLARVVAHRGCERRFSTCSTRNAHVIQLCDRVVTRGFVRHICLD